MQGCNGGMMEDNYADGAPDRGPVEALLDAHDALLRAGSVEPVARIKLGWCIAGRPQAGRRIVTRTGGGILCVESESVAELVGGLAEREPENFAWQYVDAPAEVSPDDALRLLVVGLLARIADQRDEDARRSRRARIAVGFLMGASMWRGLR